MSIQPSFTSSSQPYLHRGKGTEIATEEGGLVRKGNQKETHQAALKKTEKTNSKENPLIALIKSVISAVRQCIQYPFRSCLPCFFSNKNVKNLSEGSSKGSKSNVSDKQDANKGNGNVVKNTNQLAQNQLNTNRATNNNTGNNNTGKNGAGSDQSNPSVGSPPPPPPPPPPPLPPPSSLFSAGKPLATKPLASGPTPSTTSLGEQIKKLRTSSQDPSEKGRSTKAELETNRVTSSRVQLPTLDPTLVPRNAEPAWISLDAVTQPFMGKSDNFFINLLRSRAPDASKPFTPPPPTNLNDEYEKIEENFNIYLISNYDKQEKAKQELQAKKGDDIFSNPIIFPSGRVNVVYYPTLYEVIKVGKKGIRQVDPPSRIILKFSDGTEQELSLRDNRFINANRCRKLVDELQFSNLFIPQNALFVKEGTDYKRVSSEKEMKQLLASSPVPDFYLNCPKEKNMLTIPASDVNKPEYKGLVYTRKPGQMVGITVDQAIEDRRRGRSPFSGSGRLIYMEEKADIVHGIPPMSLYLDSLFRAAEQSPELKKELRVACLQLALFSELCGFSDIKPDNVPILIEYKVEKGKTYFRLRFCLLDLDNVEKSFSVKKDSSSGSCIVEGKPNSVVGFGVLTDLKEDDYRGTGWARVPGLYPILAANKSILEECLQLQQAFYEELQKQPGLSLGLKRDVDTFLRGNVEQRAKKATEIAQRRQNWVKERVKFYQQHKLLEVYKKDFEIFNHLGKAYYGYRNNEDPWNPEYWVNEKQDFASWSKIASDGKVLETVNGIPPSLKAIARKMFPLDLSKELSEAEERSYIESFVEREFPSESSKNKNIFIDNLEKFVREIRRKLLERVLKDPDGKGGNPEFSKKDRREALTDEALVAWREGLEVLGGAAVPQELFKKFLGDLKNKQLISDWNLPPQATQYQIFC